MCTNDSLPRLNGHLHFNRLVWVVANHVKVREFKVVNVRLLRVNLELGKRARLPLQLLLECVNVIQINVSVANRMDKVSWLPSRHMGNHSSQKGVRSNIEGNPKPQVG